MIEIINFFYNIKTALYNYFGRTLENVMISHVEINDNMIILLECFLMQGTLLLCIFYFYFCQPVLLKGITVVNANIT